MEDGLKNKVKNLVLSSISENRVLGAHMARNLPYRYQVFIIHYFRTRRFRAAPSAWDNSNDMLIAMKEGIMKHNLRKNGIRQNDKGVSELGDNRKSGVSSEPTPF